MEVITRHGTQDANIVRTMASEYRELEVRGQTVIDAGAHIGAFTRWALERGARRVIAVEPEPDSARLYRLNAPEGELHEAAIVPSNFGDDVVQLNVSTGTNTGFHSIAIDSRSRYPVTVRALRFADLLAFTGDEETALKMDIEAGEYALADELATLPAHVRALALELHFSRRVVTRGGPGSAQELVARIEASGFVPLRSPKIYEYPRRRNSVGVWRREP